MVGEGAGAPEGVHTRVRLHGGDVRHGSEFVCAMVHVQP